MRSIFFITAILFSSFTKTNAQGCVAIRSNGNFCTMAKFDSSFAKDKWSLTVNNRYFRSFRHFVGDDEQKQRLQQGTEVVNYSNSLDMGLAYAFNRRWSMAINIPLINNSRSSLYEHGGTSRHSTRSFGLGDIRLAAYRWMIKENGRGNIQLGIGLKLPTGDYKYQDHFFVNDSTNILGPVDQSIQLGDGGTGFTAEVNAYYNFSASFNAYGNFFYLVNPREQNGTSTARGKTPSAASIRNGSDVMSVPDQLMFRAGVNYNLKKFTLSAGLREECLPVHDLTGGSGGFRRPGYIISAEPGLSWKRGKMTLYSYVPFALKRNRTQSVPDKIRTNLTGVYTKGDAAFADYTVNIGAVIRF